MIVSWNAALYAIRNAAGNTKTVEHPGCGPFLAITIYIGRNIRIFLKHQLPARVYLLTLFLHWGVQRSCKCLKGVPPRESLRSSVLQKTFVTQENGEICLEGTQCLSGCCHKDSLVDIYRCAPKSISGARCEKDVSFCFINILSVFNPYLHINRACMTRTSTVHASWVWNVLKGKTVSYTATRQATEFRGTIVFLIAIKIIIDTIYALSLHIQLMSLIQ